MPGQQWCVRVKGVMRSNLSVELLVQAVIALGEQLQRESEHPLEAEPGSVAEDEEGVVQ